jgi:RNA polymerase sigma-70 factor, ECF subfamily
LTKDEFAARVIAAEGTMGRVARSYLRGDQDCMDAVQEAILKAWQKQDTLRQEAYFETWLIRILIHEAITIQRRQKRMIPVETVPDRPSSAPGNDVALRDALDHLPQKMRTAIVLFYMEGFSIEETARIMRVPKGTVSSWLHYARQRLKDMLTEEI